MTMGLNWLGLQYLSRTVKFIAPEGTACYFLPYDHFLALLMTKYQVHYGAIQSSKALGALARAHRKQRKLTLETISGLGNLSTRFLSEFERGKETAELGKALKALHTLGLEIVIQPRRAALPRPLPQPDGKVRA